MKARMAQFSAVTKYDIVFVSNEVNCTLTCMWLDCNLISSVLAFQVYLSAFLIRTRMRTEHKVHFPGLFSCDVVSEIHPSMT